MTTPLRLCLAPLAVTLAVTVCARAQPARTSAAETRLPAQIEETVTALMRTHQVPGVAVAYLEAGRLQAAQGFGFTDDRRTTSIDARTTVFEAASLGKPLFAYAVVQNARAKRIDLDAPVEGYGPARIVADSNGRLIAAAHLLSHSSGLTFSPGEGRRLLSAPGARWQYSGLGFLVLQQAVERVFRCSLDEFIRQSVTDALDMRQTSFEWPNDRAGMLAIGHDRQGRGMGRPERIAANAASSLHTTATDYARFLERMFIDLAARSDETTAGQLMIRPRIEVDRALSLSWGLGWALASSGRERLFLHWGSNPGYKALAVGSIDRSRALVVLTNGDNGLELATALVPKAFGREYPFLRFNMLHPDD